MVGKGSVRHNSRTFHAKNTDPDRSHLNVTYIDEDIREVYHTLFDKALETYNAKQKRSDRKISDYYEKICSGKQEKPFHELIIQIGNKDDTGSETETGQMAADILDEYMKGFQQRNPNLRVFSAHLHMDEATPHLHIDFVPFTTGSKRGLETRVSLKKALEAQGFQGGSRGDTEWNQWANAEKERLSQIMLEYGMEWERLGTHKEHLSVLDYKKQERSKEVAALDAEIAKKQAQAERVTQTLAQAQKRQVKVSQIEAVKPRNVPLSNQVMLSKQDYETLSTAAEQFVVQTRQENGLRKMLREARGKIQELEGVIREKVAEIAALRRELSEYKSIRGRLDRGKLESEVETLRRENRGLRDVLREHGIALPERRRMEKDRGEVR